MPEVQIIGQGEAADGKSMTDELAPMFLNGLRVGGSVGAARHDATRNMTKIVAAGRGGLK
jgi:hypothetical protein